MNITDERARENHLYDHPEEATPEDIRIMVSKPEWLTSSAPPQRVAVPRQLKLWSAA